MLGNGQEGRRPAPPRGQSHYSGADANLPPPHSLGQQPDDPRVLGVEPGQPADAIHHPLDIPSAGNCPHPHVVIAIGLLGIVNVFCTGLPIALGTLAGRVGQAAQG